MNDVTRRVGEAVDKHTARLHHHLDVVFFLQHFDVTIRAAVDGQNVSDFAFFEGAECER